MLIDEAFRRFWATSCPTFGNRIYGSTLPENVTAWPTGTCFLMPGGSSGVVLTGADGWGEVMIQTVTWHEQKLGAETAGELLRVAAHGFKGLMGGAGGVQVTGCFHKGWRDAHQPERRLHARINDFKINFYQ
jgi:hypothetical protein